jgi:hypothetical protein
MTLPDERYRSVMWAKRFLESLAYDKKNYPRIPKAIRGEAHSILRHFPSEWDMSRASDGAPDVFQKQMEPVYRMIKQYEESKNEKI